MNGTEERLYEAAREYWWFDQRIGLFKVFNSEKMEANMHIELTRNMETGEVECKSGGAVTEEMLSAVAALDLCKEGAYHDGLGGWLRSDATEGRWYSIVVNKQENGNV